MATSLSRKTKRKHRVGKNVLSKKHSPRKSIFGEIDNTKEYCICWFSNNVTDPLDYYQISTTKLRGIVDYLHTVSDINDLQQIKSKTIFLIMHSDSLDKYNVCLAANDRVRSIYVYENLDSNNLQQTTMDWSVEYPKVSSYIVLTFKERRMKGKHKFRFVEYSTTSIIFSVHFLLLYVAHSVKKTWKMKYHL